MEKKIKILAFAGSLRKQSYNRALLQAALELAPPTCNIEIFDLKNIPLYNQDEEQNIPTAVQSLKEKVRAADALLIATPEYSYSIPGVLKNALDWGSRPYGDNAWNNKPVALIGASMGMMGSARAQYHVRQVFVSLNMHALNKPELMVATAQDKFDASGRLTDSTTRQKMTELLKALVEYTRRHSPIE